MRYQFLAAVILIASIGSSANASLVVNNNISSPTNVASVLPSASGSDMIGMQITANFLFGGSQTLSWAATGPGSGGVSGTGWSLTQSGDSFSGPWTLTSNRSLTRLTINAFAGNTVFDRRLPLNATGTPGSSTGRTISNLTGDGFYQVNASYGNPVSLSNTFYGDLFGSLDLTFSVFNMPVPYFGVLTFTADTDQFTAVPEPSSITLSSIALFALVTTVRRRRSGIAP